MIREDQTNITIVRLKRIFSLYWIGGKKEINVILITSDTKLTLLQVYQERGHCPKPNILKVVSIQRFIWKHMNQVIIYTYRYSSDYVKHIFKSIW